ncbi:hypothetical protein H2200_006695 [Cladophialophora chaetospira]|uniref:Uncharacterized protein n=1 Tax=Cladophialophora chaetospira TaxID=386627 RepID=A0AA39CI41_9EURO|nr:hypothetical protein H2200_006695 [Cladophialophora chaetospira]
MRTTFAVAAGLVAVAYAGTTTITDTVDVTITSCEPTVTNCPYKPGNGADHTWSDWVSASTTTTPVKPATTSSVYDPSWSDWESTTTSTKPAATSTSVYDPSWSDWESTTSTTSSKPVSPATTSSVYDGTWSDWEASTLSTSATPVKPASTTSTPVAAASTGIWSYSGSATGVAPATYTGAANVNAGSFALAGLAAAAVMVIA